MMRAVSSRAFAGSPADDAAIAARAAALDRPTISRKQARRFVYEAEKCRPSRMIFTHARGNGFWRAMSRNLGSR